MNIIERLERIDDHFDNLSLEQLEENLERAGIKTIKPASFMVMVTEDDIQKDGMLYYDNRNRRILMDEGSNEFTNVFCEVA